MQKVRSHPLRGSYCLYVCGFRIYFTPLPGFFSPFPHGTGSLSVDYEYLALEDGPPIFKQDSTCPALLFMLLVLRRSFHIRGYHPLQQHFPEFSINFVDIKHQAGAHSLAATSAISVDFFSCSYLDVSVHYVRLVRLCIHLTIPLQGEFPHSEICGSMFVCQLPTAFRRLPRPSSPVIAKASTTYTQSLDPITLPPIARQSTSNL